MLFLGLATNGCGFFAARNTIHAWVPTSRLLRRCFRWFFPCCCGLVVFACGSFLFARDIRWFLVPAVLYTGRTDVERAVGTGVLFLRTLFFPVRVEADILPVCATATLYVSGCWCPSCIYHSIVLLRSGYAARIFYLPAAPGRSFWFFPPTYTGAAVLPSLHPAPLAQRRFIFVTLPVCPTSR